MNNILKAWSGSFTRRWHNQPQLCETNDPISGHQQRCTMLLLLFWSDASRESIIDTLIHDQGETDSGDMPHQTKQKNPEIRSMLEIVESDSIIAQGFENITLTPTELRRRKFVDLLDSYLWMLSHKPIMSKTEPWRIQLSQLYHEAEALGIENKYDSFIKEAHFLFI